MSKSLKSRVSLVFKDKDTPEGKFVKQITKHSKNAQSASSNGRDITNLISGVLDSKTNLDKKSTLRNFVELDARVTNSRSEQAFAEGNNDSRLDFFGTKIEKNGKKHKILFSDHIKSGRLAEIVEIQNLKFVTSYNNSIVDCNNKSPVRNEAKGQTENCSCICVVF